MHDPSLGSITQLLHVASLSCGMTAPSKSSTQRACRGGTSAALSVNTGRLSDFTPEQHASWRTRGRPRTHSDVASTRPDPTSRRRVERSTRQSRIPSLIVTTSSLPSGVTALTPVRVFMRVVLLVRFTET